jgi:hypothetical protein
VRLPVDDAELKARLATLRRRAATLLSGPLLLHERQELPARRARTSPEALAP